MKINFYSCVNDYNIIGDMVTFTTLVKIYSSKFSNVKVVGLVKFLPHNILLHENSVGLSSTTNPKPKGQPSISLPAQANLTQQKTEPLRCLALRTRGGRLKSSFVPWELSLPT